MFPYIHSDRSVTVVLSDGPLQITSDHPNFGDVVDALAEDDATEDEFRSLMAPIVAVKAQFVAAEAAGRLPLGTVTCDGRQVLHNGEPVHPVLTTKILDMLRDGFNTDPWIAFVKNIYQNPSFTAIAELYLFLESAGLPITADGCFLAYKRVGSDYKDLHSRTFDNTPGSTCSVPRHSVDDNRDVTCSYGLHACAWSYLPSFGAGGISNNKVVMVKINPADVVTVPADYKNAKLRVTSYVVVADVTEKANAGPLAFKSAVSGEGDDWDSYYEDLDAGNDEFDDDGDDYDDEDYDDPYDTKDADEDGYAEDGYADYDKAYNDAVHASWLDGGPDKVEGDASYGVWNVVVAPIVEGDAKVEPSLADRLVLRLRSLGYGV